MKTREQIETKEAKELARRKSQNGKKALKYGLAITLIALFCATVVDEISSAIGVQIQSSVVTEFFVNPLNLPYNEAMSMFSTITMFSYALLALVPFYKALSDKLGRKPFLVINTVGMGIGMLLAWWSPNVVVYFIGYGMTVFFVQHDMQIVYLYEIVPKNRKLVRVRKPSATPAVLDNTNYGNLTFGIWSDHTTEVVLQRVATRHGGKVASYIDTTSQRHIYLRDHSLLHACRHWQLHSL